MISKADLINSVLTEIAPKYFDEDELNEITKSRLGVFGMVTETMGTMFENSTINNAIKAKERLSITASRSTLLEEAAGYPELTIPSATPSRVNMFVGIPTKYLEENHQVTSSLVEFILHEDTIIKISQMDFMLDYSVKVTGRISDGVFNYSAQYLMNNENPLSYTTNPYLITSIRIVDGEPFLMINLSVSQKTKEYQYFNLIETDPININGIEFKYEGQLAYFNVFYKKPNSPNYNLIQKINYLSKTTSQDRYIYFDDATQGTIRLFIPEEFGIEFNSEIRLDIYTTLGKSGSFTYTTGSVDVLPQSFQDMHDYSGLYFNTVVISNSVGGKDELSTDEIRRMVIDYKSTLRGIDTENDLNTFFRTQDQVNDVVFIKKRIDVFEKQYAAFMALRDQNGIIIPTNTLDINLTEADFNNHYIQTMRRVIKPNTAYSLKPGEGFVVVPNNTPLSEQYIRDTESDPNKFLFGSPYLIVVNENPTSVSYYMNSVDRDSTMFIEYANDETPLQFIINRINMYRNAIMGQDEYTLSANVVASSALPDGIVDSNGNILDPDRIKMYGFMYSEEDSEKVSGYFPMDIVSYSPGENVFKVTGKLKTDEYISLDDKLRIVDSIITAGESTPEDYIISIDNIKIGIGIFYSEPGFTNKGDYAGVVPEMSDYGLLNVYSNGMDRTVIMVNMSKIIRSVINIDEVDNELDFEIKQVPLVRYSELRTKISDISEALINSNATISNMLQSIRNNSSIDYKFYATYGRSRYFTMENTSTFLNKLNIDLEFKVRVPINRTDVTLVSDIRLMTQQLVESINSTGSANNSVYFSNIITQIENEFKYNQNRILSFELVKINDYDILYQSIVNATKPLEQMTKPELLEYVPEFVKLDIGNIKIQVIPV